MHEVQAATRQYLGRGIYLSSLTPLYISSAPVVDLAYVDLDFTATHKSGPLPSPFFFAGRADMTSRLLVSHQ
jgi:hypothetical protein